MEVRRRINNLFPTVTKLLKKEHLLNLTPSFPRNVVSHKQHNYIFSYIQIFVYQELSRKEKFICLIFSWLHIQPTRAYWILQILNVVLNFKIPYHILQNAEKISSAEKSKYTLRPFCLLVHVIRFQRRQRIDNAEYQNCAQVLDLISI